MKRSSRLLALRALCLFASLSALLAWSPPVRAYDAWSSCVGCHGGYLTSPYASRATGQPWGGSLHDVHRTNMLSGDCYACHVSSGRTPVYLARSQGGTGLSPSGCVGCHDGAGLRQHHRQSGASQCSGCHAAPETPVAENVLPPYYFTPDAAHPTKPTDPCNGNGSESFAATSAGLDNDGNGLYDLADPACAAKPVKADAGPAQTVKEGATVTLNGSNSTGTGLTYSWSQTGTPAVTLATPTASTTLFSAPAVGPAGATLTFQLTVTDGAKQTSSATTTVTVTDVNQAPIASAGSNQTVPSGSPVTLDGSNSVDPDGSIASYAWTQLGGPAVSLSNAAAAKPSFVAPISASPVSLSFQLVVRDNLGLASAPATVAINVAAVAPPVADAGATQTVAEGTLVTLDGSRSTGTTITYRWTQTSGPSTTLSDPAGVKPTFTAPPVGPTGASLTFQLTVTDAAKLVASASVIVNVTDVAVNQPPVADAGMDQAAAPGATVALDGSASFDPDGSVASYLWSQTGGPSVTLSDPAAPKPTLTAPSGSGTLTFQLKVTDGGGLSAADSVTVQIADSVSQAVQLSASLPSPQAPGTPVTFTAQGRGPAASYFYRFSLKKPGRNWSVVRSYESGNTWTWKTREAREGIYQIKVEMKAKGARNSQAVNSTMSYVLEGHHEDQEEDDVNHH